MVFAQFYYNRNAAVNYANTWCNKRNPQYKKYTDKRGDCANFVSQCLIAGGLNLRDPCNPEGNGLNGGPTYRRVRDLINYLECFAREDESGNCVRIGDIVVWYRADGTPYHVGIITQINPIRFSAHTNDRCNANPGPNVRFYRILDYYEFYSEYIGGYYYRIGGGLWIGPIQTEGVTAVGYKPASLQEFAGFSSFSIQGISQNTEIYRAYLRLVLMGTGQTIDPLHFNIKYTGNITPPDVYSIITPPFHLVDQIFPYLLPGSYRYYPLPASLYPYIRQANNTNSPFVLGYSRYTGCNSMRYFWDYTGTPSDDASLLVFVDPCPFQEDMHISSSLKGALNILTNPFLEIKVEEKEKVTVEIFDVCGRLVLKPVDETFDPGIYKIKINMKELENGVYFLVLKRKEKQVNKFIILK